MGKPVIEADTHTDASWMVALHAAEELLVGGIAGAQRNQIHIFGDDVADHLGENVGSLLPGETRDDAEQRPSHRLRRQSEFPEQLSLADLFPAQVVH